MLFKLSLLSSQTKWILLAILLLGTFLRFYQLGEIPLGLNQDETAIGYNAYSILQTGRDEYGVFMPLYFKSQQGNYYHIVFDKNINAKSTLYVT